MSQKLMIMLSIVLDCSKKKIIMLRKSLILVLLSFAWLQAFAQGASVESFLTQARSFELTGKNGDAERSYLYALREAERVGQNNPKIGTVLRAAAEYYRQHEQYDKAEQFLRRDLELTKRLIGADHADVAGAQWRLARALFDGNQYSEAESLYSEALNNLQRNMEQQQRMQGVDVQHLRNQLTDIERDLGAVRRAMGK